MKIQLETVLEQVVDPLSITYFENLRTWNEARKTSVLYSRQSMDQIFKNCDDSYLLGVCYFEKYLQPQDLNTIFDDCLVAHGLVNFVGNDFCALHEAIADYPDFNYAEFLKGICFAHEALPVLMA